MIGKVIQGLFMGGRPRIDYPQIHPAMRRHPPGPPGFAPRVAIAQAHGAVGAFPVDATRLGLAGGGQLLPDAIRNKMEAALGGDFRGVRVHVGPQAERIGAIAFTVGTDIYFAPGRYQPETVQGQQVLGHELAHVMQQRAGRVRNPLGAGTAVVQDRVLEAEADRLGHHAASHRVAVQPKMLATTQLASPVRISAPIRDGEGGYRLTAGMSGRQIGSVMVHARERGAVEVTDLGVDPAHREHGVGKMLLASAARTAQQLGRSRVTLAAQDNGSGHLTRWYEEMGFTRVGVNRRGYPQLEAPIGRMVAGLTSRQAGTEAALPPFKIQGSRPTAVILQRSIQRMEVDEGKLAFARYKAFLDEKGKLTGDLLTRLAHGQQAIQKTRQKLRAGAGNITHQVASSSGLSFATTNYVKTIANVYAQAGLNAIEAWAIAARRGQAGNCDEFAAVAYFYLLEMNIQDNVSIVGLTGVGHHFVVIGDVSNPDADDAVVVDAWPDQGFAVRYREWTYHGEAMKVTLGPTFSKGESPLKSARAKLKAAGHTKQAFFKGLKAEYAKYGSSENLKGEIKRVHKETSADKPYFWGNRSPLEEKNLKVLETHYEAKRDAVADPLGLSDLEFEAIYGSRT